MYPERRRLAAIAPLAFAAALSTAACRKDKPTSDDAGASLGMTMVSAPSATSPGAPKPGMIWIPAGVLRAGTAIDEVPRVASEELPGVEIAMGGFYIDMLPFPNEAGAIPSANVTRDEAGRTCENQGKRLCTELEWERACKGPNNTRFEYGDVHNKAMCGTGVPVEEGAQRPSGERATCKSAFGVREMHGGIFEWTDSPWGRGAKDNLGVLRGGNGPSGELYGRCANAMGKPLTAKGATMGFRCCAGPRNEAKVDLKTVHGQTFSGTKVSALPDAVRDMPCNKDLDTPCGHEHAWVWQPIANVEIFVKGGCVGEKVTARCGMILAVMRGDEARVLAHVDAGHEIPEAVLMAGDGRRIRIRGHDTKPFFREVTYNFGRLDVAVSK